MTVSYLSEGWGLRVVVEKRQGRGMKPKQVNQLMAAAGKPGKGATAAAYDSSPKSGEAGQDHVDVINQMFAEFELAYHNQFHRAFSQEGSLVLAKKYWLSCLGQYPPLLLLKATRHVVTHQEFLPTVSSIVQACENALGLFGLPESRDAYLEACRAPSPKAEARWSHPAVYHAGRETGWFELASQPESQVYPRFEYCYKSLCRRVMAGETLETPLPEALPSAAASRPLTPEQNRKHLAALRANLSL